MAPKRSGRTPKIKVPKVLGVDAIEQPLAPNISMKGSLNNTDISYKDIYVYTLYLI